MITDEQLAKDREAIPFTPVKRLMRDDILYIVERDVPHPVYGYSKYHKEYSVIDLRGYRKGYEPRLDIKGTYTLNPTDIFRLEDGHLPPYQPTTTGDKLLAEMRRLGVHKAFRIGKPPEVEEIKLSGKMVEIPLVEGKAVYEADNPDRVRFDRASIDSAIAAAKRLESNTNLYIFATYLGYTIDKRPPPGMQSYIIVHPDGSTETVESFGGNPVGRLEPWQMPKEEFVKVYLDRFKSMLSKEALARVTTEELAKEREEAIDYQKHTIKEALAVGKLVPREVLKDYPEFEGGNPVRTEPERKSFHERIFGKGSTPPLKRLGRGQTVNELIPMPPEEGPPLPRMLAIRWPWKA